MTKNSNIVQKLINAKPSECSLSKQVEGKTEGKSCLNDNFIKNLANKLGVGSTGSSFATILNNVKNALNCSSRSNQDRCIVEGAKNKIPDTYKSAVEEERKSLKPLGPRDSRGWLSDRNIQDVMKQYQDIFPDFYAIPFQMRDFAKQKTELATLDFKKKYDEGYRTFGVVINTDYSYGPGIHWFCMFFDFRDSRKDFYTVEYFNSSGNYPLPEINQWIKNFKHSNNIKKKFNKSIKDILHAGKQYQYNDYSCGVYSLVYILIRLSGVELQNININDNIIDKLSRTLMKYN
jgi:hypothetical protein